MSQTSSLYSQAVAAHQAGQFPRAGELYQQVLQANPDHADSWHLLGVLAHQTGNPESGIEFVQRAISINPNDAAYHGNLALIFKAIQRLDDAESSARNAIKLNPGLEVGLNCLGMVLRAKGQLAEAVETYRCGLNFHPFSLDLLNNIANALRESKQLDAAINHLQKAQRLNPNYPETLNNLAICWLFQNRLEDALAAAKRAVEVKPNYAEAWTNLGNILKELGRADEAIRCYEQSLQRNVNGAPTWLGLGTALRTLGKTEDAITALQNAIALDGRYGEAHSNLASLYQEAGRIEEAGPEFETALALQPDNAEVHHNYSHWLLLTGNFERGWQEFEWRFQTSQFASLTRGEPLWNGENIAGKRILVHAEQGLGDTLQFVRYLRLVKELGATVFFKCQRALSGILADVAGVDQLVSGDDAPAVDFHVALLSLPRIFQTTLATIPHGDPYLFAKPNLVAQWRAEMDRAEPHAKLRVGINWQGNPHYAADQYRSIPLAEFAPLFELPDVAFFSLQKEFGREQLAGFAPRAQLHDWTDRLDNEAGPFMDTAAMVANLDLVITSDTALPHLAAALGRPVWVALPLVPDWRWLLGRTDSPWYPTVRLFRQKSRGDWSGVFWQLADALRERLHGCR